MGQSRRVSDINGSQTMMCYPSKLFSFNTYSMCGEADILSGDTCGGKNMTNSRFAHNAALGQRTEQTARCIRIGKWL